MVFPTVGVEPKNLENMEYLYASIEYWGTEEDNIPFPYWKVVDEYRDSIDSTSLSAKFVDMFPEVENLV